MHSENAITVEGLEKSFGTVRALNGLSMGVKAGTVCGFIGPNGAGKTTTMRILLGLLPPDRGKVTLLGEDVVFGKELRGKRRIAYLPQDPVFPERHTAQEIMELVGDVYGLGRTATRRRTDMLLEQFDLAKSRKRSVGTFSRGMRQRLGLATCFLPEPDLLVLDEPVSALDPEGRVGVFDALRKLKGRATVLFSSHILEDVERICDCLVMIKDGQKVLEGPMLELLARYAPGRLRVTVRPEDLESAASVIGGMAWAARVNRPDNAGTIIIDVQPSQMEAALDETVLTLVRAGVRVRECTGERADLEALFFRLNSRDE